MLVGYVTAVSAPGTALIFGFGRTVMRISSSLVAPSALAVLSTVLLSGTAASQTATGPTNQLPSITIQAPKQVARRPHRPEAGAAGANTVAARPTSPAPQTPPTTAQ